jgi:hypothetical protein
MARKSEAKVAPPFVLALPVPSFQGFRSVWNASCDYLIYGVYMFSIFSSG